MRRTLTLLVFLAGCQAQSDDAQGGSVGQAVMELSIEADPLNLEDILACLDLPEERPIAWLLDHVRYNEGCFDSWSIKLDVVDCPIGDHLVSGKAVFAGDELMALPRTGLLIRARAAAAASADLSALAAGDLPHLEAVLVGEALTINACAEPVPGGMSADVDVTLEHAVLGVVVLGGAGELTKIDDVASADFLFAVSAASAEGPAIDGELTGTGIARLDGNLCPDTGEIQFSGTIDGESGWMVLTFIGADQYVIDFSDGSSIGPKTLPRCGS